MIDYLRLAFGTFCVFLPGAAVARAFGQRSASATLAWTLAAAFVAWTAVFTFHRSIHLAAAVLAVIAVAALLSRWRWKRSNLVSVERRRRRARLAPSAGALWLFGVVLGWAVWHAEGQVVGDGLFHEARVRKLVDLTSLHLRTVDEFKDGGLHPGYAFPLWHGVVALVSWFSGLDAETVLRHEPSLLVPLACVVAWEAGAALFGSRWAGVTVLLAVLALFCFGAGHGGSFAVLTLPATASRQLLVPAAIALFFTAQGWAGRAALAAIFGGLALTHPTYALFLLVPLAAFAVLRAVEWRQWSPLLLAAVVPTGLVLAWLKPIVDETVSHDPGAREQGRALAHYGSQLVVTDDRHFRLAAQVLGRSGAVAVATLVLLPVTALAIRRRWAAFVLGGAVAILLLMEVPWLFVHLADVVSLSQARRAAGFLPVPFAFAGAFALLARRVWTLPVALVAGVVVQQLWPGDFEYGLRHGGPAIATWIALVGGAIALVAALALRPPPPREHHALGALAALCFVLPTFANGLWHWSPQFPEREIELSPTLLHNLRTKVPRGAVVLAPVKMSYEIAARAPVYIVAAPVTHVADTRANQPNVRVRAVNHWVRTNDPAVARRYGATWAIRRGRLYRLPR